MPEQLTCQKWVQTTLILLCLKKLPWKSFGILVASINGKKLSTTMSFTCIRRTYISICEYPEDMFWKNLIIPSAISLKVLEVVTATWEFTIAEKSRVSASFLRADVKNEVGSKIFNNCDLLLWYIFYFL